MRLFNEKDYKETIKKMKPRSKEQEQLILDQFRDNWNKKPDQYFWSMIPGEFVNKYTGEKPVTDKTITKFPKFAGTKEEWRETLLETIIDATERVDRHDENSSKINITMNSDYANFMLGLKLASTKVDVLVTDYIPSHKIFVSSDDYTITINILDLK